MGAWLEGIRGGSDSGGYLTNPPPGGGSGGSGSLNAMTAIVAPGKAYELSRWVGYTLRHLSFSVWLMGYYPLTAIAITNLLPKSLHPRNLVPALWQVLLNENFFRNSSIITFNFAPGLIRVGPGERLYVVIYDMVHSDTNATNTGQWAINMLWEPYSQ